MHNKRGTKEEYMHPNQMFMDPQEYGWSNQMYESGFYEQETPPVQQFNKGYIKQEPTHMDNSPNLFYSHGNVDWSYNEPPQQNFQPAYPPKYYPQGKKSKSLPDSIQNYS